MNKQVRHNYDIQQQIVLTLQNTTRANWIIILM